MSNKRVFGDKQESGEGFETVNFYDSYGTSCSVQHSSLVAPRLWVGCNDANPEILVKGLGWTRYPVPDNVSMTTRMHLDVDMVKKLIVELQSWLEVVGESN